MCPDLNPPQPQPQPQNTWRTVTMALLTFGGGAMLFGAICFFKGADGAGTVGYVVGLAAALGAVLAFRKS